MGGCECPFPVLTRGRCLAAILLLVLLVSGVALLSIMLHPASYRASKACSAFREFASHIDKDNWEAAEQMVAAGAAPLLRVQKGQVLSHDTDVTATLAKARPRFWVTFDYYRNPWHGDKVIFKEGYALLEGDKIKYIKIP